MGAKMVVNEGTIYQVVLANGELSEEKLVETDTNAELVIGPIDASDWSVYNVNGEEWFVWAKNEA